MPGSPTDLENSRARTYCACSKYGWGCLDILSLVYHFSLLSPTLRETVGIAVVVVFLLFYVHYDHVGTVI